MTDTAVLYALFAATLWFVTLVALSSLFRSGARALAHARHGWRVGDVGPLGADIPAPADQLIAVAPRGGWLRRRV